MSSWIASHKALIASIASAATAVSGVLPPPYKDLALAVAIALAALSGGPAPASPPK